MNAPKPSPAATVDEILEYWEEARERGRRLSPEDLCQSCPHLLDEVRRHVRALEAFDSVETLPPRGEPAAGAAALPTVPGYELQAELGRGGMGVVFKARQIKLNRTVALKMILAGTLAGVVARNRFRVEAEAAARLQHPNIVQVFEVGEAEGQPFAALEYVSGGTLADRLDRRPVAPAEGAALVETVARAVQHAHERGIVHRDLKPGNILLAGPAEPVAVDSQAETRDPESGTKPDSRRSGHESVPAPPHEVRELMTATRSRLADSVPKVSDFGLAKLLDTPAAEQHTRTGAVFGTPGYMAPEQARGEGQAIGPPTDVYALGAILYELLTGRPPFEGEHLVDVLKLVTDADPVRPRDLLPSIPRDVETVCLKCLEKEPRKRYPSAAAMADDLRRFLDGLPVVARPVGRIERAIRWCRRNPRVAALVGLVVVLLVATAVVSAVYAVESGRSANNLRAALAGSQLRLAESDRTRGQLLCEGGDIDVGLLWLARSLEDLPADHDDLDAAIREELGLWLRNHRPLEAILPHAEDVTLLALSPDGKRVLTVSGNDVQVWDTARAKPVGAALRAPHQVSAVAFSPDGTVFALGGSGPDGDEEHVSRWDPVTGEAVGRPLVTGRGKPVQALAWSPDGRYLAAGTMNLAGFFGPQELFVWDVKTGESAGPNAEIKGHFSALAFSPDSKTFAAFTTRDMLDGGAAVQFFQPLGIVAVGEPIPHPAPGPGMSAPHALSFTANGRNLWSVNAGRARRWDVGSGRLLDAIPVPGAGAGVVGFLRSGDGFWAADGAVARLVTLGSGQPAGSPLRHGASITQIAAAPDGSKVFTAGRDRTVRVWGAAGSTVYTYPSSVRIVAASPDGKTVLTADESGQARLHAGGSAASFPLPTTSRVHSAEFSPYGAVLLTVGGSGGRSVHAWRTTDGTELRPPQEHDGFVSRVRFAPDGKQFLTASWASVPSGERDVTTGRLQVWDAATGKAVGQPIDAPDRLFAFATFANGKIVGVTRQPLTREVAVGVWDAATGKPDGLPVPVAGVATPDGLVAASADGAWVALPGLRGGVRIWDLATRKTRDLPAVSGDAVTVLVASADGRRLLVGKEGGVIAVYEVASQRLAFQVQGHAGRVRGGYFGPDGNRLTTYGIDGTLRLWDARTGAAAAAPLVHPDGVWGAVTSPDGRTLITGCQDGAVRTWQLSAPVSGSAADVVRMVEKRTGLTLGTDGAVRALTAEEWASR